MIPPFVILIKDTELNEKRVLINLDQVTFIDKDPSTGATRVWFAGFHCERVTESIDLVIEKMKEFQANEVKARWR